MRETRSPTAFLAASMRVCPSGSFAFMLPDASSTSATLRGLSESAGCAAHMRADSNAGPSKRFMAHLASFGRTGDGSHAGFGAVRREPRGSREGDDEIWGRVLPPARVIAKRSRVAGRGPGWGAPLARRSRRTLREHAQRFPSHRCLPSFSRTRFCACICAARHPRPLPATRFARAEGREAWAPSARHEQRERLVDGAPQLLAIRRVVGVVRRDAAEGRRRDVARSARTRSARRSASAASRGPRAASR